MAIRGVLVDAAGVLQLPDPVWLAKRLRRAGLVVDPAHVDRAHYAGIAAYDRGRAERPRRQLPETYGAAWAEAAGLSARHADAVEQVLLSSIPVEHRRPLPGSVAALRTLASKGLRIAVVANTKDGTSASALRNHGICQVGAGDGVSVVAVLDSADIGLRKPDRRIYVRALTELGMEPPEAVHVGDSLRLDVHGARAAGIHPIHYDPFGLCTADDHDDASSFPQVVSIIDRLNRLLSGQP